MSESSRTILGLRGGHDDARVMLRALLRDRPAVQCSPVDKPRRAPLARGAAAVLLATLALAAPALAMTSHAGWPPNEHLVMDKGPAGQANMLSGEANVHNYLLGGYGNDTIYGGSAGDVIWGDYHPTGESKQTAVIHAGNGKNFIYSNDTINYV